MYRAHINQIKKKVNYDLQVHCFHHKIENENKQEKERKLERKKDGNFVLV